jgi:hypothetical protein
MSGHTVGEVAGGTGAFLRGVAIGDRSTVGSRPKLSPDHVKRGARWLGAMVRGQVECLV